MCGICGIINFDNRPVDPADLKKMNEKMLHRGPDDEGYFCLDNVGLAMRRLSIIDLDGGRQPIANEDDSIWVVMNGEIYNYLELRRELISRGHKFKSSSDTEVIVHLYEEKGRDCVQDLNGMFSFAISDTRNMTLLIARDRLGIKPLYYSQTKNQLVFASDLNALRTIVSRAINLNSLLHYLGQSYGTVSDSIYQNIKKLTPAHLLWIENSEVNQIKYWQINKFQNWSGNVEEAAISLENHLRRSVELQMRSDVPVGVFLSGGLDSSIITAFAAKISPKPLNTFTINFDNKNGLDNFHARNISSQFQTNHLEVSLSSNELLKGLDELIEYLDEPLADSAIVPTYLLSKIARQQGIKVLLTGAGGDEIFGGYRRYQRPALGSPVWVAETFPTSIRQLIGRIWKRFQPNRGWRATDPRIAFASLISGANLNFYEQIFKDKSLLNQLCAQLQKPYCELLNEEIELGYTYLRMRLDLNNYLSDNILSLSDKGTMAASVEGRVPLLDHQLVEFAFSLPEEINLLNKKPKGLLKKVAGNYLTREIIERKKEGFNAPMRPWLTGSFCRKVLDQLACSNNSILNDLIDLNALETFLVNPKKRITAANSIFCLYVFSRWEQARRK